MTKLTIQPKECNCFRCSSMCHAPCCGTPDDFNALIKAGYANRLMFDPWPGGEKMLKPALKGYEGEKSPWEVRTLEGCTFWKNGLCELHSLGLKPLQGKLTIHDQPYEERSVINDYINNAWTTKKAEKTIAKWHKIIEKLKKIPKENS